MADIIEFTAKAINALKALEGHDRKLLLAHANRLKGSDGEGWAIGEMVERALAATVSEDDDLGAEVFDPTDPASRLYDNEAPDWGN